VSNKVWQEIPIRLRTLPQAKGATELWHHGETDEAIRRLREGVDLEPGVASYWNSLGMTLGGDERMAEAEKAFREAWRLDDKSHRHAYNLGLILLRQGRASEARPFFEKALSLDPRFAPARERLAEIRSR